MIKSTAIDPSLIDEDECVPASRAGAGVHARRQRRSRRSKRAALRHGDVMVLICGGPQGAGMQEIYQITSALKRCRIASMSRC